MPVGVGMVYKGNEIVSYVEYERYGLKYCHVEENREQGVILN